MHLCTPTSTFRAHFKVFSWLFSYPHIPFHLTFVWYFPFHPLVIGIPRSTVGRPFLVPLLPVLCEVPTLSSAVGRVRVPPASSPQFRPARLVLWVPLGLRFALSHLPTCSRIPPPFHGGWSYSEYGGVVFTSSLPSDGISVGVKACLLFVPGLPCLKVF